MHNSSEMLSATVIETPRLRLRNMTTDDLDALLQIFGDPLVMAAFHEPPFTSEQMAGWLQRNLDHQAQFGYGCFSVLRKPDNQLIGDCGLEVTELDGIQFAELAYDFRRDCWGQGYATEAAIAVRDYAFTTLNLSRLIALIQAGNESSRRVAEKIGMKFTSEYDIGPWHYWKYELAQSDYVPS